MIPPPNNADDDQAKSPMNEGTPKENRPGRFSTPAWIGSSEPAFGLLGFLLLMPFATVIGTRLMPTKVLLGLFAVNSALLIFWSCWLAHILRNAGPGWPERMMKALNGWMLIGYLWMSLSLLEPGCWVQRFSAVGTNND